MVTKSRARATDGSRLDMAAWTEAALDVLATNGIDGVRVEVLAKRLDVTKGSFYWHFKDRDALYDSMLDHWRRRTTLGIIERLDRREVSPAARLRKLLQLPVTGRGSAVAADVELAIRLWGRRDNRAQRALEEVDQLRLRYIGGLLQASGVPAEEIEARAVLAYSYIRVAATLVPHEGSELMKRCEDILLGVASA